MKQKILAFFGAVMIAAGAMNLGVAQGAWAAGTCPSDGKFGSESTILGGLVAWYNGLKCKDGAVDSEEFSTKNLPGTIGKIAGNILQDLFFAVGVLAVGYGIYAGFLMITSQGDPALLAKGKKTLTRAITGLVIAILATTIVLVIRLVFWR